MEDEDGLGALSLVRDWIVEQVYLCDDFCLLDLIYKMLLFG